MYRILPLLALATSTLADTVTYNFNVGWVTAAPDGFARPVLGVNGQWPIPNIEANVGDQVVVNVVNNLGNQSTSLHFHGMYQYGTAGSDGGVGLSQCAIPPGGSFTYSFTANPAGTHWYHSHDRGQYPDGLRGMMIIHDPVWEAGLGVTDQIPLALSDWYHDQMPDMLHDYLAPGNTVGDFPSPVAHLVNETTNPPTFNFLPGKKYMLRIANVAAVATQSFEIQDHTMQVVGIDGVQVVPQSTSSITLSAGQRYTVIVQAKSNPTSSFKYAAKMSTDMFTRGIPSSLQLTVQGKVNYVSKLRASILNLINNALDTSNLSPSTTLDDLALVPLDGQKLLGPVSQVIAMSFNQTNYPGIGARYSIGAQPWVEQDVPTLFSALSTGAAAMNASTYGPGAVPYVIKSGQIVQISMKNNQPYPHPMHLHGHEFQIVARGSGSWNGNTNLLPQTPSKRDVVTVPANGYTVVRFIADNPGVWFLHCHIDFHLAAGMAATFIEAPDLLQQSQQINAASAALCQANNMPVSGNCQGDTQNFANTAKCNTIFNTNTDTHGAVWGQGPI